MVKMERLGSGAELEEGWSHYAVGVVLELGTHLFWYILFSLTLMGGEINSLLFPYQKEQKVIQKEIILEIKERISHMWIFFLTLEKCLASKAG